MLQTVRAEEVDEKSGVICLVSIFPSCVMVFKLSKKVNLFQFCADLSKKPKSVKASYIYASESSHSTFLENNMVYRGRSNRFFFHLGFLSRPFTNYRTARKGKRISRASAAESSPLRIASSRTRTGNLWFPSASC